MAWPKDQAIIPNKLIDKEFHPTLISAHILPIFDRHARPDRAPAYESSLLTKEWPR